MAWHIPKRGYKKKKERRRRKKPQDEKVLACSIT